PTTNEPPCTLAHPDIEDKKAKKVVSEYYKKQNEFSRTSKKIRSRFWFRKNCDLGSTSPLRIRPSPRM
ncbi:hypothetical protein PENTCL1PPCAC_13649, partial [Pristionchus entomophagus]